MSSDDNERSREWVERLPAVLKSMNNEVTRLTGKEPQEVLKSKQISINAPKYNRPVGFDEVRLSPFSKVRYLFAPGEYEGGERRRATDPVWSLGIFELSHSKVSPDQPVMYYLSGGPKRSFVREELQVVPEDSEAPPKKLNDSLVLCSESKIHCTNESFNSNKLSYLIRLFRKFQIFWNFSPITKFSVCGELMKNLKFFRCCPRAR